MQNMGGKVGGDLRGVGEGETIIRKYCIKKIYFQLKRNIKILVNRIQLYIKQ